MSRQQGTAEAASARQLRAALLSNSGLTLVLRVVTTALALLTVPWLIGALGASGFGIYSVIVGITGFLTFVDAGLAVGVRTRVAEATARGDVAEARRAVAAGVVLLGVVALGLASTVVLSTLIVPWSDLLGATSTRFEPVAVTALALYIVLYAVALPMLPAQRALEGLQRVKVVTALTAVPGVVLFAGVYVLREQDDLLPFTLVASAGSVVAGACGVLALWRLSSDVFPRSVRVTRPDLQVLWAASWPMVVVSIALSLSYALDPVVIASHLGAEEVAEYALANRITQIGNLVYVSTVPVLWTHFARQRGHGNFDFALVRRLSLTYVVVAACVGAALVLAGPAATEFWSRGAVRSSSGLFLAFAVWGTVLAVHLPAAMLQSDARSLRFQACTTSLMAAVNVPLSLVLVNVLGVAGPVWASALTLAVLHATPILWRARRLARGAHVQSPAP